MIQLHALAATVLLAIATPAFAATVDRTLPVGAGAWLEVRNPSGLIRVTTWPRSEVRVVADLPPGERLEVERKGAGLELQRVTGRGAIRPATVTLTVPASTAIELTGRSTTFDVSGVRAPVRVNGLDGDATVRGGRGRVVVRVVNGAVHVSGAVGDLDLRSTAGPVTVEGATGTLTTETTSGDIRIASAGLERVKASSLSGHIALRGSLARGGLYVLASHSGDVGAALVRSSDVTVTMTSEKGRLDVTWPGQPPTRSRRRELVLGSGAARLEMESFEGVVRLGTSPATGPAGAPRARGSAGSPPAR